MAKVLLPLSRFRVIDLTAARAGPTAVRVLADWGAKVIKIEPPLTRGSNPKSVETRRHDPDFQNLHRNKRSLTLDLKSEKGKMIFFKLCEKTDVIVENFRSEVKYRLGIDYGAVKEINPRIVYGSISGFGQDGPYGKRPGVDQIVQGMSGLMSITGEPGRGPMRVGIAISDSSAGILLANGILIALLDREVTGQGRWVHTSLLESMINMMDFQAARWTVARHVPPQVGNDHPTMSPMGVFNAADGQVNIAASSPKMFRNFCVALSASHLLENPNYSNNYQRALHRQELNREINEITEKIPMEVLVEKLNGAGCPCGPIYRIDQAFADPQVPHLEVSKPIDPAGLGPIGLIRTPINMPDIPGASEIRQPAPELGQHSDEVLAGLGYDEAEISGFREAGII
ncbi:MAG: CoA transferase [Deltaproteobacteria bacterium]|nr:CoA transferase [Deltaproteobacteria bacterium]